MPSQTFLIRVETTQILELKLGVGMLQPIDKVQAWEKFSTTLWQAIDFCEPVFSLFVLHRCSWTFHFALIWDRKSGGHCIREFSLSSIRWGFNKVIYLEYWPYWWRTICKYVKIASFLCLPEPKGFFLSLYCKGLVKLLKLKLTKI